jgi:nucleotide-binding universal stress UspA family protein
LLLAAVIKPPELPIPAPYPEELQQISDQFMKISREAVRNYLAEIQARIPVKTENRIVENESIFYAIHELVEKENIDLVILCAHGMTGRVNWPYGSVARNYIEYGTQTVLVIQDVPRSQARQTPAEIAAEKYGRR